MDPGHLDESVSLKEASKWMVKFERFVSTCHHYGYNVQQYKSHLKNRLDDYWTRHIGKLDRFAEVTE